MKKATPKSSPNHLDSDHTTPIKGPTKIEECLILLLTRHETNTFDANRAYGDSCLHSEISSLQKDYSIMVDRVKKQVPSARSNSLFAHYFLVGENRIKAMALVDRLRAKRNAEPMRWKCVA